jgi:3-hydroxyisobutyrate dehydrogenase-like beta-hydroxyacid dehydrogenase
MKIGFIGFGEAAFELATGLKREGLTDFFAFDPMSNTHPYDKVIKNRITETGTQLCKTQKEVAENSNIIMVAVPADKTLEAAQSLCQYLKANTIYVDVSASTPKVKREVSKLVNDANCKFIDIAMMGPLPIYKHQVPMLASGDGSHEFISIMSKYGMDINEVGQNPGDASSVKLIRSIFMKGLATLFIETLVTANYYKVDKLVIDSIIETFDTNGFQKMMNRLVTGTAIHSGRRSIELTGSLEMLNSDDLDSTITKATKEKLDMLTIMDLKTIFNGEVPDEWERVIEKINNNVSAIN